MAETTMDVIAERVAACQRACGGHRDEHERRMASLEASVIANGTSINSTATEVAARGTRIANLEADMKHVKETVLKLEKDVAVREAKLSVGSFALLFLGQMIASLLVGVGVYVLTHAAN